MLQSEVAAGASFASVGRLWRSVQLVWLSTGVVGVAPLIGQSVTDSVPDLDGFVHSFGVGVWGAEGDGIFTLEYHATRLSPTGLGVDFALATPPEGLQAGVLALGADLGIAYGPAQDRYSTVLRGGLSIVMLAGGGGGEAEGGVYLGASQFLLSETGVGIRLDLAHRRFAGLSGGIWSLGVGLAR